MTESKLNLSKILSRIEELELMIGDDSVSVGSGYVSDLLSDVMRNAGEDALWVTIQHHENVVAVALMADVSAIAFANGVEPDEKVIQRAKAEEVTLFRYPHSSYELAGRLYEMGLSSRTD